MCWKRYRHFGRMTILKRFTQPARDRGRAAHLDRSDSHFSNNGWKFFRKSSLKELVINIPQIPESFFSYFKGKYGSRKWPRQIVNKNSSPFWIFNLCPDRCPNWSRIDKIEGMEDVGFEINKRRSSAYKESLWTKPKRVMPSNSFWFLSQMASGSMAISNNKGKSGQPCWVPRLRGNYAEWMP